MKSFSFLLLLTIFFIPMASKAAPTNFGGQIMGFYPCLCSKNWIFYIRDVRYQFLPLVFQPGVTIVHKMYSPRPGVNSLGNYTPGTGICLVPIGSGCGPLPTAGTIFNIGTSLAI